MKNFALIFFLLLSHCASSDLKDAGTAEGAFQLGQKLEKSERYEEALTRYTEVKNKHPYSRFATRSEFRIAEVYFKKESYIEAESSFKIFKELHPNHDKIDYVTFQLAMSYFQQLPDSIDRDLSKAHDAILYFNEVVVSYPSSDYAGSAKDHKVKLLKMLASKELYIATFYFKRDQFDSALNRYETILKKYPNVGLNRKTLYGATVSAYRSKAKQKAREYYLKLAKAFPNSEEQKKAERELTNEGK